MSTTSSPAIGDPDQQIVPSSVFDRAVWHNPRVCNGCLERVKTIATTTIGMAGHDVEDHHRTPSATLEQDEEILEFVDVDGGGGERPGHQRRPVPRTTCLECGRVGCWGEDDSLGRIEATRRCKRIFPWLRELGVAFDRQTIARYVFEAKGDPDRQGEDTDIFREAVAEGVRAARQSR